MERKEKLERRGFLSTVAWAITAIIGLVYSIPAIRYLIGPSFQKDDEQWLLLASTSKIEPGQPTLFKVTTEKQTGWITEEKELSSYLLTDNGRDFVAMSNICTHLGCRVRWIEQEEQFFCPCHNAVFDRQGNVVAGPPPRPLDRYQTKVEDGQVYILAS